MKCRYSFLLGTQIALACAILGNTFTSIVHAADAPAVQKKEVDEPKITFSPEIEAKMKKFLDAVKAEAAKAWDDQIKKKIAEVATVTGLSPEGQQALEPAAKKAVATWTDGWAVTLNEQLRREFEQQPQQVSMMLDQMLSQVSQFASAAQIDWRGSAIPPFSQDGWNQALRQTLTPDQMAAWDKSEADRKAAVEKEVGDNLKAGLARIRDQQTQEILSDCTEIEISAGLSKDRADKLEALGKSVVDLTSEMWRKRVETTLLAMDDNQRKLFSGGRMFVGTEKNESPNQQPAWKDGLTALLTPDEMARLQAARDARKAKRDHVMGEIMVTLLDEKLALTVSQREKLQPVADRLVKNLPDLNAAGGNNIYINYAPGLFYTAAGKATDADLKPILDDVQREHWRHLSGPENEMTPQPVDDKSKPEEHLEPEDVEKSISLFLYEKTAKERKRLIEINTLKAEDVIRATGVDGEIAARLEAACRGATEESLATWKWFVEQQIRSQLQEATPQNVKQRLNGFQDYFFQRTYDTGNHSGVWDKTVQTELNPKQLDSWHKETDARQAFHDHAVGELVLAEFDRKNQLSADQWDKLDPLVVAAIHDYSPDVSRVFSFGNGVPWYLGGPYILMPFAAIPDTDLQAILTPAQWDRWKGSPEHGNSINLWQSVQQFHNQRIPPTPKK